MRSRHFIFLSSFLYLALVCVTIFADAGVSFEKKDIVFTSSKLGGRKVSINVELAVTEKQKAHGFMNRKVIPEGTGMIFLYSIDEKMHFWMKDTPTPLSIAFISSKGQIKEIKELNAYSLETVSSAMSCRYALEVPRGMFKRLHINVGDEMTKDTLLMLHRMIASQK